MRKIALLLILLSAFGPVFAQSEKDSVAKETQKKTEDVITQPEFKGGIEKMYEYINHNFQYPEDAQKRSIRGRMEVEFTVEKSGDITYVGILKGLDYSIDEEVLRLIKGMPRWIPATKNGEPVRYKVSMPINIRASRKGQRSNQQLSRYDEQ
ncbi:MAG: energy transducer TonB [Bacteroidaceae bacterium]|nr:energy transducer TonB [Bacteroidaceae bacterium]MBR5158416.1 energy transducer TonB [Bacteroidaceae bacterium]